MVVLPSPQHIVKVGVWNTFLTSVTSTGDISQTNASNKMTKKIENVKQIQLNSFHFLIFVLKFCIISDLLCSQSLTCNILETAPGNILTQKTKNVDLDLIYIFVFYTIVFPGAVLKILCIKVSNVLNMRSACYKKDPGKG